jgi:uroporphyrinogen decarboxylase
LNRKLLDALEGRNQGAPPVWLMRQAGRYMPDYQAIRSKHSLEEMFKDPSIIEAVSMLPIDLLDVDALIVFSDILLPLECMGYDVHYPKEGGPYCAPKNEGVLYSNKVPAEEQLSYVYEAIKRLKPTLDVPLIGFTGAPFTMASYAIEPKGKHGTLYHTKRMMYEEPEKLIAFLDEITDVIIEHAALQVSAGADVIQVFDSWAGLLSKEAFELFCLPYLERICRAIQPFAPVILFARGSSVFASEIAKIKPNCISVDWTLPINEVRQQVPHPIALQGNLDPSILFSKQSVIEQKVHDLLQKMEDDPAWIMNLGHGVLSGTPQENVKALVDAVHSYSCT